MFAPEEQQVEICLLKSNLKEIENDLIVQRSSLPALDAENEQQYRETLNVLRLARAINTETERLRQENMRLIAKRMQLKKKCENVSQTLQKARDYRNNLMNELAIEEKEEEEKIRLYEDSLCEISERFRKARVFYNEDKMNVEIKNIETLNTELGNEVENREASVDELYNKLQGLSSAVPDNILHILGKSDLEDKLKKTSDDCEAMQKQLDRFSNKETGRTKNN